MEEKKIFRFKSTKKFWVSGSLFPHEDVLLFLLREEIIASKLVPLLLLLYIYYSCPPIQSLLQTNRLNQYSQLYLGIQEELIRTKAGMYRAIQTNKWMCSIYMQHSATTIQHSGTYSSISASQSILQLHVLARSFSLSSFEIYGACTWGIEYRGGGQM